MTSDQPSAGGSIRGKLIVASIVVAIAVPLALILIKERRVLDGVRNQLEQGRQALLRDQPAEALEHLRQVLAVLPQSGEANFLAARASRQEGDIANARSYLALAEKLGRPAADIELEDALLKAKEGRFEEVETLLNRRMTDDSPDSAEIIAMVVPLYMGNFRIVETDELTTKLTQRRPESAKAWTFRADTLERLRKKTEAIDAYRRLVEIAPNDRKARLNLARLLNENRQPVEEALKHVEWLLAGDPNDPAALVQLALCRESQGQFDVAVQILDKVIATHPTDAKAHQFRGRLEINRGGPQAALKFLRKAVELEPSDVQLRYSFYLCMQQTGTSEEIREAEQSWKNCEADLKRVSEVAAQISRSPGDPNLRREIGEIFLRNERFKDGIRWLQTALDIDPNHVPTHRVLADYYEKSGQKDLAKKHREMARDAARP